MIRRWPGRIYFHAQATGPHDMRAGGIWPTSVVLVLRRPSTFDYTQTTPMTDGTGI
jgi:hypothetical protein